MHWSVDIEDKGNGRIDYAIWKHTKAKRGERYDLAEEQYSGHAATARDALREAGEYIGAELRKGGPDT